MTTIENARPGAASAPQQPPRDQTHDDHANDRDHEEQGHGRVGGTGFHDGDRSEVKTPVTDSTCPSWCRVDHETQRAKELLDLKRVAHARGEAMTPALIERAYASADGVHLSNPSPDALVSVEIDRLGQEAFVWSMDIPMFEVDSGDLSTAREGLAWAQRLVSELGAAISALESEIAGAGK